MTSFSSRIVRVCVDKSSGYTGKDIQNYCLQTGIKQNVIINTPHQIGEPERLRRTHCTTVWCLTTDWDSINPLECVYANSGISMQSNPSVGTLGGKLQKYLQCWDADLSTLKIMGAKTRTQHVVPIKTTPELIPQPSQFAPPLEYQSPSLDFTDYSFGDNYVSSEGRL